MSPNRIPDASAARMALYFRALRELDIRKTGVVSSEDLAQRCGVTSPIVRKDLSYLGPRGRRGIGYSVSRLVGQLEKALGLEEERKLLVVGVGNLGRALLNSETFELSGYRFAGAFDVDEEKLGKSVGDLTVRHINEITSSDAGNGEVGVITTPAVAAQQVADHLVKNGISRILNFTPVTLSLPRHVVARNIDLAVELQLLCHAKPGAAADPRPFGGGDEA